MGDGDEVGQYSEINKRYRGLKKLIILLIIEGMFNGATVDLAEKPYIPQKILLQLICCKCLAGCNRHSYF